MLPDMMSLELAALTEPMGCAIRAARLSGATATSSALVTGLGPIGLLIAQVLKENGVRQLWTTDTDPDRRGIAAALGIHALDPGAENVVEVVRAATGGDGVDVALDAVGADATRRDCIQAVAWGGRVIFTGLHAEESTLQANYIIRSEITIQGSFAYTPLDFTDALAWLAAGRITIEPWILHAPLAEGGACFERLLTKPGPVAKILLES
jgi:threonine dehydrogenase-like Zn-dependent dehydrogenase